jgi:hypothetical protein
MKRITAIAVMYMFVLACMPGPALAASPSFNQLSASSTDTSLDVSFKLTGLGSGSQTFTVTLTGTASWTCQSSGKNGTQETQAHQTLTTVDNFTTHNGSFSGSISLTGDCPGHQTVEGFSVSDATISESGSSGSTGPVSVPL